MREMAIFLLDHGANPSINAGCCGSAMAFCASQRGLEGVMEKTLTASDANVNNPPYGDLLQTACYSSTSSNIKVFLESGAKINAPPGQFGDAIQASVFSTDPTAVSVLLDHGADANSPGTFIGEGEGEGSSILDLPFYGKVVLIQGVRGFREHLRSPAQGRYVPLSEILDNSFAIEYSTGQH
jgi:hypothetical protein